MLAALLALSATPLRAAVGCTLNDPDRDIMRIFPEATNYSTDFISIEERGGRPLYLRIEERLGDELDDVYEAPDVAYAYYTVLEGDELIGRVHGVNQKGTFGGMQLILATDPEGVIVDFYYQRLSSPEAVRFTDETFTGQFVGLTLLDLRGGESPDREIGREVVDPSVKSAGDFEATVRGVRKNLILLDEFMLGNRYLERARATGVGAATDEPPAESPLRPAPGRTTTEEGSND